MNAYVVKTRDMRSYVEPMLDDGSGPIIPVQPMAPVVAVSPAQAKRLFLDEFSYRARSGVYDDDWNDLRVRLLYRDVPLRPGLRECDDQLWGRIHEIEDHNGAECDCGDVAEVWDDYDPRPSLK